MIRRVVMLLVLTVPAVADADTVTQFAAELTPEAVITLGEMPSAGISQAFGSADFVLTVPDVGSPTLTYTIEVHEIDFGGQTGFPMTGDDLTALHFHDTTQCSPATRDCVMGVDTVGTQHVLNVTGSPREDDKQVMRAPFGDAVGGIVTGEWDDGDEDLTFPPSNALSGTTEAGDAILDLLFDEKLFVNVHTNLFNAGEIGGFIRLVPEPSSLAWVLCGLAWLVVRRRQARTH